MDKREMIEKVLERFLGEEISTGWQFALDVLGLSREAIVIECEVEHDNDEYCPLTIIEYSDVETRDTQVLDIRGIHGIPGKAVAIIVSLEEK